MVNWNGIRKTASQWVKQLVTPEDHFHIHKTLGCLVLISTLFRLRLLWCGSFDMGFRDQPEWTVPTVMLHAALNLTSFQFHLPEKRIKTGYRIWPEYRWHSLVFLMRSLVAILLNWMQQELGIQWPRYTFLLLVLGTMACADWASKSVSERSGFAREMDAPALVRYFFSVAQCGATAYVMAGDRRCGLQFIFVLIIQWNAFFMTLRRKNLANQTVLMTFYGVMMGLGIVTARVPLAVKVVVHLAAVLRTGPRLPGIKHIQDNKYLLWVVMYIVYENGVLPYHRRTWFPIVDGGTFLLVLLVGYHKYREVKSGGKND